MAREGRRAKTALVPGAEAGAGLAPGGDCGTAESGELEDRTGRRINRRRERAGERGQRPERRGGVNTWPGRLPNRPSFQSD